MMQRSGLDGEALGAGWRVLRRHLRYASGNPRKLWWIAQRVTQILVGGELRGVLQRHRVVEDLYRDYPAWLKARDKLDQVRLDRLAAAAELWPAPPRFSVLLPVYCPPIPFLQLALQSVVSQRYRHWELCIVDDASPDEAHLPLLEDLASRDARVRVMRRQSNGGIAQATNDALAAATGDYCVFLDQDDLLSNDALLEMAARAVERPHALVIYGDEDRIDAAGVRSRPMFKPDWDPEWLRTTNCIMHPVALRTAFFRDIGGLRAGFDGVQDWDLLLRIAERVDAHAVEHVAHILYHWREHRGSTAAAVYEKAGIVDAQERALRDSIARRGERADVTAAAGGWRIGYALPNDAPLASVVIPTRDRADLLQRCLDGLRNRTSYERWEAIVIDNGSIEPETRRLLDSLASDRRFTIIRDDRGFNYSMLCNEGVAAAKGEMVVLLNNDIDPINREWLTELIVQARRPHIGMVGAMLYYPNDTIQHAGVVLGLNGVADRPYIGYARGFQGVDRRLLSVHSVTAMITACCAIRRAIYEQVGGMDEALPVACNDLDLCLRVAELGYRNVITPHAELYHHESASRGYHYAIAASAQEAADEAHFRQKWRDMLGRDPFYNPNLTLKGTAYSLSFPTVDS